MELGFQDRRGSAWHPRETTDRLYTYVWPYSSQRKPIRRQKDEAKGDEKGERKEGRGDSRKARAGRALEALGEEKTEKHERKRGMRAEKTSA